MCAWSTFLFSSFLYSMFAHEYNKGKVTYAAQHKCNFPGGQLQIDKHGSPYKCIRRNFAICLVRFIGLLRIAFSNVGGWAKRGMLQYTNMPYINVYTCWTICIRRFNIRMSSLWIYERVRISQSDGWHPADEVMLIDY